MSKGEIYDSEYRPRVIEVDPEFYTKLVELIPIVGRFKSAQCDGPNTILFTMNSIELIFKMKKPEEHRHEQT